MKHILTFTLLLCLSAPALAQVWCRYPPGATAIPPSHCCGDLEGTHGLAKFLREYFELMQIDCMLDIFFDALMFDDEVLEFYLYVSGDEFEELCRKLN